MTEGFLMDARTGELFFRVCRRYKVDGREARIALMRVLVQRGKAKYIRDANEFLADKRVLRIEKKRSRYDEKGN